MVANVIAWKVGRPWDVIAMVMKDNAKIERLLNKHNLLQSREDYSDELAITFKILTELIRDLFRRGLKVNIRIDHEIIKPDPNIPNVL